MEAIKHSRQAERLQALNALGILDTPREADFDEIVELASLVCGTPISVINLIDEHRQWFKAEVGLGVRETPLATSICSHVILEPGLTEVEDMLRDLRFADNPLCTGDPHLRFYAGAVLETAEGLPIGTLCVLDHQPRRLTDLQRRTLQVLAKQVMAQIRLRQEVQRATYMLQEVDHRVKNSLSIITSILSLQASVAKTPDIREALLLARNRVMSVSRLHDQLHSTGSMHEIDFKAFIEQLVGDLRAQASDGIEVAASCLSVRVSATLAVSIGIVTNELVTNALRHGFGEIRSGRIEVNCTRVGERMRIAVRNSGKPLPHGFDPAASTGLGMRVATASARQLGGQLEWSSGPDGVEFAFDFPNEAVTAPA